VHKSVQKSFGWPADFRASRDAPSRALLLRFLDSCHASLGGRRVTAREATAQRLGLEPADRATTMMQRGDATTSLERMRATIASWNDRVHAKWPDDQHAPGTAPS
jgi:hypothetical protein